MCYIFAPCIPDYYSLCTLIYISIFFFHIYYISCCFSWWRFLVDENNQVLRWLELIGSIWYAMHNRHITNTWWIRKCIFGSEVEIIQLTPILFLIQLLDICSYCYKYDSWKSLPVVFYHMRSFNHLPAFVS